jgi:hypothetical protein
VVANAKADVDDLRPSDRQTLQVRGRPPARRVDDPRPVDPRGLRSARCGAWRLRDLEPHADDAADRRFRQDDGPSPRQTGRRRRRATFSNRPALEGLLLARMLLREIQPCDGRRWSAIDRRPAPTLTATAGPPHR